MSKISKLKVRSGGQRGIDQLALLAAQEFGLQTCGYAPKGYRVQDKNKKKKSDKELLQSLGLTETIFYSYTPRTRMNVEESDATIIFALATPTGSIISPGSIQTLKFAKFHKKPFLVNPTDPEQIIKFIQKYKIKDLNIAGNRETLDPENAKLMTETRELLYLTFNLVKELNL